jgi:hypothetical protein
MISEPNGRLYSSGYTARHAQGLISGCTGQMAIALTPGKEQLVISRVLTGESGCAGSSTRSGLNGMPSAIATRGDSPLARVYPAGLERGIPFCPA